jgi:orotate phosphoribosyltransferase
MFDECKLEGNFTLSSGRKSSYFYDFDLLSPKELADYTKQLVDNLPDDIIEQIEFIACPAIGGIVMGFLAAFALDKRLVIVDKSGKIRGTEFVASRYLIMDDVITTYKAANRVQEVLGDNMCAGVAAFIFRGNLEDLTLQEFPTFFLARKEPEFLDARITGS